MKKIISVTVAAVILLLSLAGCSGSEFDFDKTAELLEANGFMAATSYDTEYELKQMTYKFNEMVYEQGGAFQVEIERYVSFLNDNDHSVSCTLVEFTEEEQAKQFIELYLFAREGYSEMKIARSGKIIVYTDSTEAQKNLKLEFR